MSCLLVTCIYLFLYIFMYIDLYGSFTVNFLKSFEMLLVKRSIIGGKGVVSKSTRIFTKRLINALFSMI